MAVSVVALVVAVSGLAFAGIPGSGGEISGCYTKANGNLRVVEDSSSCRTSESPLSWNQVGGGGGNELSVEARARSTGPTTSTSVPDLQTDPGAAIALTGNEYTQGPLEINKIYGEVTVRFPAAVCNFRVLVGLDGAFQDVYSGGGSDETSTATFVVEDIQLDHDVPGLDYLPFFESGPPIERTVTATVADDCADSDHYVVESLKADVVALR
jgi:hypothetical protein